MVVNPDKIKAVIDYYGKIKGHAEKSYLPKFTEEHKLNYKQWAAFCNGSQTAGYKVVDVFMDIFPNLDLNYLIKDSIPVKADMFNLQKSNVFVVNEPEELIKREVSNLQIFTKLEEIHFEIKSAAEKK
jgi:hypothetical protein